MQRANVESYSCLTQTVNSALSVVVIYLFIIYQFVCSG